MTGENGLYRGIVRQTIRDLASNDLTLYKSAVDYIGSATFSSDCEKAGYPPELRDSLKEMVLRSQAQRTILCREIIQILDKSWDKKNPT